MVIRLSTAEAKIEIKKDLSRFEDSYYDFISISFDGLPITVASFTPYLVPTRPNLTCLAIDPVQDVNKKICKQYYVMIDSETLSAKECVVEGESGNVFSKIFFVDNYRFLGQRRVSPITN